MDRKIHRPYDGAEPALAGSVPDVELHLLPVYQDDCRFVS